MTLTVLLALALAVIGGITVAWWATYRSMRRRMEALHRDYDRLGAEIETRMQLVQEKQDLKHALTDGLAQRAPMTDARNRTAFPRGRDGARYPSGAGDRIARSTTDPVAERAVHPIREAMGRTEHRLSQTGQAHTEAWENLAEQLRSLNESRTGQDATAGSSRPYARHRGELSLERIVELAGMAEHCTFERCDGATTATADVIVRMPQDRTIAIDGKTSIEPFVRAVQARDAAQRQHEMACFVRELRSLVARLSGAPYRSRLACRPECIVLFVPSERLLLAAREADPQLQTHASQHNVILASPSPLLALLRMIADGWRRQTLAASTQKMRAEGVRLYEQLRRFTEHGLGGGDDLWQPIETYNRAVSALEYQLAPRERRLAEWGIDAETVTAMPDGSGKATPPSGSHASGEGGDDPTGSPR